MVKKNWSFKSVISKRQVIIIRIIIRTLTNKFLIRKFNNTLVNYLHSTSKSTSAKFGALRQFPSPLNSGSIKVYWVISEAFIFYRVHNEPGFKVVA